MTLPDTQATQGRGIRAAAAVQVGCFGLMALALTRRSVPEGANPQDLSDTIYPWWVWVLVAVGLATGLLCLAPSSVVDSIRRSAPAAAAVAAAQLAGTGIVAVKHWEPTVGMGGFGGNLAEMQYTAAVIGVAGLVAVLACVWQLVIIGQLPRKVSSHPRLVACCAGAVVILGLPLAVAAGDADHMMDVTSLGAFGLIYAGPWGAAIIATGWLPRASALAMLGGTVLSISVCLTGPQMTSLVYSSPSLAFAATLLLTLAVGYLRRDADQWAGGLPEALSAATR